MLLLFLAGTTSFAQKAVVVKPANETAELFVVDSEGNLVKLIKTKKNGKKCYLIKYNSFRSTFIASGKGAKFSLWHQKNGMETEKINLNAGESISLRRAFSKHGKKSILQSIAIGLSTFVGSSKQLSLSQDDFATAYKNSQVKKPCVKNYTSTNNIEIGWDTREKISKIKLTQQSDKRLLWSASNYDDTTLVIRQLPTEVRNQMKQGNVYEVSIAVGTEKIKKESICFSIEPFVFDNENPAYFLAKDSLIISWNTIVEKVSMKIVTRSKKSIVWQTENVDFDHLTFDDFFADKAKLKARKKYQLIAKFTYKDKDQQTTLDFEILLDNDEHKQLLDFLNSD